MKHKMWFFSGFGIVVIVLIAGLVFLQKKTVVPETTAAPQEAAAQAPTTPTITTAVAREDIEKVRALMEKGDSDEAITVALTLVGRDGDAEVLGILGDLYCAKKEYEKSEQFLNRALEKFPGNSWFLRALGMTNSAMGKFEKAIEYYTKAIEADTSQDKNEAAYAYWGLSRTYEDQHKMDKAIENAKKAVQLQPNNTVLSEHLQRLKDSGT